MEQNQRLKQYVESKNISQKEFSGIIDSTQQYVSALLNSKRKLGSNVLERLQTNFTDLNIHWLLTGEGEMLKGEKAEVSSTEGSMAKDPKVQYGSMAAMHQDIKSLAEGMTHNFESVSRAMMLSLKNQTKILDFVEKLNAEDIKGATAKLNRFLEEQENVKK